MFTQKENKIAEEFAKWMQSIGINLEKDSEQV